MRREHADGGDASGRQPTPGYGQQERKRRGATDRALAFPGGVHALDGKDAGHTVGLLVTRPRPPEVVPDRPHRLSQLSRRHADPDLIAHQVLLDGSAHGAGTGSMSKLGGGGPPSEFTGSSEGASAAPSEPPPKTGCAGEAGARTRNTGRSAIGQEGHARFLRHVPSPRADLAPRACRRGSRRPSCSDGGSPRPRGARTWP